MEILVGHKQLPPDAGCWNKFYLYICIFQVLVQELTLSVTPPLLKDYMRKGCGVAVSKLIYGLQPGDALCVFEQPLGEGEREFKRKNLVD